MNPLIFALAFVLVALLVYLGRYSGKLRARHSRVIAAPPEVVRARVAEFAQWRLWNPWLEHAPAGTGVVDAEGRLSWDLPAVGRATVRTLSTKQGLAQRMEFALPFAFRGRLDWRFEPVAGGTLVRVAFNGRVAFTLRAFAATVQGALALDLRWGLDRLAASLESGAPAYRVEYLGEQAQPASRSVQQPHRGRLDALASELPALIASLRSALPAAGPARVFYLRTQLKRRIVDCKVSVEWSEDLEAPDDHAVQDLPAHAAYVLRLEGPPEALELAWYQGMQRLRVEQRQPHPQLPPYERYVPDPVSGQVGVVELYLPLKS